MCGRERCPDEEEGELVYDEDDVLSRILTGEAPIDAVVTNEEKAANRVNKTSEKLAQQKRDEVIKKRKAKALQEKRRIEALSEEERGKELEAKHQATLLRKEMKKKKLEEQVAALEPGRAGAGRLRVPSTASVSASFGNFTY